MTYNMINGLNIVLDIPYPKVENLKPNKQIAYKLKKAYCGNISELSCTTKYIYQHILLPEEFKEIKNVLKQIAIVEMRHLEIIGEMLKNLGLLPVYTYLNKVDNEVYFESSFISYEDDLPKFIAENIEDEKKAIKLYQKIINDANDSNVTNILQRIILDEENHIKIFKSILNNLL